MKKYHYVYKITNLNPSDNRKYYIGVRTSNVEPELDIQYQSSSKYLKEALKEIGYNNFKKEILSIWDTRTEANLEEARLHELFDVAKNPEYYNKAKAKDNGFCTEGMVTVIEKNTGKKLFVTIEESKNSEKYTNIHFDKVTVIDNITGEKLRVSKEEFRNNKNYEHIIKGKITAIDNRTGLRKQVTKEEFENNDYLVGQLNGKVNAVDIRTGFSCSVSKEEFEKYDYYEHNTKHTTVVIDIRNKILKRVSIDDYNLYNYYISPKSKLVEIYDDNDNLKYTVFNNFKGFCKENNLPFNAFSVSKQNSGKPLYDNPGSNIKKLQEKDYLKYKGWYAVDVYIDYLENPDINLD